jgi:hypothetical protein
MEIALGDAHLPAEGDDFIRRETVTDVPLAGLQFGGTLYDPLDRRAINSCWEVGHKV